MPDYYYTKDVAKLCNININTISSWIANGKLPKPKIIKINYTRHRAWPKSEIDIWASKNLCQHESDGLVWKRMLIKEEPWKMCIKCNKRYR